MDPSFWHSRWSQGRTGFHLPRPNPTLVDYAPLLLPPADGTRLFVPLCGKSHDLRWLARRGHRVVGVELSEKAARAFFEEQQLPSEEDHWGPFLRLRSGGIELLIGDLFDLTPELLGPIDGAYDRAALIALPAKLRRRYAEQMASLLPPGAPTLLLTFEYPQVQMEPPPFSVDEGELRALYGREFDVQWVQSQDVLANNDALAARGLSALQEHVFWLLRG